MLGRMEQSHCDMNIMYEQIWTYWSLGKCGYISALILLSLVHVYRYYEQFVISPSVCCTVIIVMFCMELKYSKLIGSIDSPNLPLMIN